MIKVVPAILNNAKFLAAGLKKPQVLSELGLKDLFAHDGWNEAILGGGSFRDRFHWEEENERQAVVRTSALPAKQERKKLGETAKIVHQWDSGNLGRCHVQTSFINFDPLEVQFPLMHVRCELIPTIFLSCMNLELALGPGCITPSE